MEAVAKAKWLRSSPRKVARVAKSLQRKSATEAIAHLSEVTNKGAFLLRKVIRSAMANARVKNPNVDEARLSLKEIRVEQGPRYYRYRFCARGRVHPVRRRFCHIRVILTDGEGV